MAEVTALEHEMEAAKREVEGEKRRVEELMRDQGRATHKMNNVF